jgi:hypothetical protein
MSIDKNILKILINFFEILGVNLIASILANLIAYKGLVWLKLFAPEYNALIIGVTIGIIAAIVFHLIKIPSKKALALGVLVGLLLFIIIPIYPLFEITDPRNGDAVPHIILVKGHGGIPDSEVKVFVITDQLYPQGNAKVDANGKWSVYPVYIGEQHSRKLEAMIYANMTTPRGNTFTSNYIKVKRQ